MIPSRSLRALLGGSVAILALAGAAQANPEGGSVSAGSASISGEGTPLVTIHQSSDKAIINWNGFSVGVGERTDFIQPGRDSITLNRVTGEDPSRILGSITATGTVVLVNPNGVLFGESATVDAAGLVATTHDVADGDFMDGGPMRFDAGGVAGAEVVNEGRITIRDAGVAAFVAPHVRNDGIIVASLGKVQLAAGEGFTIDLAGDGLVAFAPGDAITGTLVGADGRPVAALVENGGTIRAEGGYVALTAAAAREVVNGAVNAGGLVSAAGVHREGGTIVLDGGAGDVTVTGSLDATGTTGGSIALRGDLVVVQPTDAAKPAIDVRGETSGGAVAITADVLSNTGGIRADGASGGLITVAARNILQQGLLSATGSAGDGGGIRLSASGDYVASMAGIADASGTAAGGLVALDVVGNLFSSGGLSATGGAGDGGLVDVLGGAVSLVGGLIDASGGTAGGVVRIGGDFQGGGDARRATETLVSASTVIQADATGGAGGRVIVWSDEATEFGGTLSANGPDGGGFAEISSKGGLTLGGTVDVGSGTLLLDPKDIVIDDTAGVYPQYQLVNPNPSANDGFGTTTIALASGRILITASRADLGASNAGAAYLFDGTSGALISALVGSTVNDQVGKGGATILSNGNYVIVSSTWTAAGAAAAGAVTWGSSTTGVAGAVSASNSLVGSAANDHVGIDGVEALSNGNYVVVSATWGATDLGAVTWGSGTVGVAGAVSSSNSTVGSTVNDQVGSGGVTALSNGNYVIDSPVWTNGSGAVTWRSGASSASGAVTTSNSLYGLATWDGVGSGGITALSNGNYVVASPIWGDIDQGAVTWGSGTTGVVGPVLSNNSILGSIANDRVGSGGVTALTNGNYVIASPFWSNGSGAVTWRSGTTATSATVTTVNSLYGLATWDGVGSGGVTALSNGNYVVSSPLWGDVDQGAVSWGDGVAGTAGAVTPSNSLLGSAFGDNLGRGGITALSNGSYVIASPDWDNGGVVDAGAVTWGSGTAGVKGTISGANSLIGSTLNDRIGSDGVTALTNGNYVVVSRRWDNAGLVDAGAVTWGSGTAGTIGTVSISNSLVGSTADDQLGFDGVVALSSGNYVVGSRIWDNGSVVDAGAVTWGNGTTGIKGTISAANSLVGTSDSDLAGANGVVALSNGNYVVIDLYWRNGDMSQGGAVTWGNGATGTVGAISDANSLVGNGGDRVGAGGVSALADGNYVVISPYWSNVGRSSAGAVTWGDGTAGTTGTVSAANSIVGQVAFTDLMFRGVQADGTFVVSTTTAEAAGEVYVGLTDPSQLTYGRAVGQTMPIRTDFLTATLSKGSAVVLQASNDLTVNSAIVAANASGTGGALTLQAGRSIALNALIDSDDGDVTLIGNDDLASGVVNADRDAGAATITFGAGGAIDAGLGDVSVLLRAGTAKTNSGSGAITLGSITAATITVVNGGPTAGSGVSIASGATLTASGSGNAVVIAGDDFTNNAGSTAISLTGGGRFLVYSADWEDDTRGGLAGASLYNRSYAANAPASITQTGNLFIHERQPILTVTADPAGWIYGAGPDGSTFGATVTGLVNGDTAAYGYSGTASVSAPGYGGTSDAGSYTDAVTAAQGTLASDVGYGFTFVAGDLEITPASLTITADNSGKVYGQTDPTLTATIDGLTNGDTADDILGLSVTREAGENVDTYDITASGATNANYTISYGATGTFTITPASLTITADNSGKVYGETDPALTATIDGLTNGDTVEDLIGLSVSREAGENVDTYDITASGATNANYTISYGAAGTFTITKASLTITADNSGKVYGETDPTLTATIDGLTNGDTVDDIIGLTVSREAGENVNTYMIGASGATSGNYTISYGTTGAFTITPAALTITADDSGKVYGQSDPTLTAAIDGLVNGDTVDDIAGLLVAREAGENVESYDITASGATNANYTISYGATATFTITKASLTITADASGKVYGETDPTLTATIDGLVNGDTVEDLAGLSVTRQAGETVGGYDVTASGAANGNYTISYGATGTFTITKAALTITADNGGKVYGATDPTLTATIDGLVHGDTVEDLLGLSVIREAGENVGSYDVIAAGATNGNYTISYGAAATFGITPASLTIRPDDVAKLFGDADPVLTASASGLVNGDTIDDLIGLSIARDPGEDVGTYAIGASGATNANYVISYEPGVFAILEEPVTPPPPAPPGTPAIDAQQALFALFAQPGSIILPPAGPPQALWSAGGGATVPSCGDDAPAALLVSIGETPFCIAQ